MEEKKHIQLAYTLDDITNCELSSCQIFIIAHERVKNDGSIGRYYVAFSSFALFLKNRDKYTNSHEILIDHLHNPPNPGGRLVFDFDIKDVKIPTDFKEQIERTIVEVIQKYFHFVDTTKFRYIWSTTENPKKFSKHLTVKNLYFADWLELSKIFFRLFCLLWDEKYNWIPASGLIDTQIARNHTTLRMVGSCKIGGNILQLDNEDDQFVDSLIRIYREKDRKRESNIITMENLDKSALHTPVKNHDKTKIEKCYAVRKVLEKKQEYQYPEEIYLKAFQLLERLQPGIFLMYRAKKLLLNLRRLKPEKCLLSQREHEEENACLIIYKDPDDIYRIHYYCFRECSPVKKILLGFLSKGEIFEFYQPPKLEKRISYLSI